MEQYRWLMYAILGALVAAAITPLGKKGVEGLDSNVVTAVRSIVQALICILVVTFMGQWQHLRQFTPRAYGYAALTGLAGGLSWLCMFKAMALPGGDATKVAPIDKLSMPIGVILAVIFLKERPNAWNWVGVAMMVAGAVLAGKKFG